MMVINVQQNGFDTRVAGESENVILVTRSEVC